MTGADADGREAQLQAARHLRAAHKIDQALALLAQMEPAHPQFSRLHHERGLCHALRGDARGALAALHRALQINPMLPASWDLLAQVYAGLGDETRAQAAAHKRAALEQMPAELVVAHSLAADGDHTLAEQVLRDWLAREPANPAALHLLGRLCTDIDEAERVLARAVALAEDHHAARFDYAQVLLNRQQHARARAELERLLTHDPANRAWRKALGKAAIGMGDFEAVIDVHGSLLAEPCESTAEEAELRLWRANALKTVGRTEAAIAEYRAALRARPDQAVAWFSLANLKTFRFADADLAQMRVALAAPALGGMDRIYLHFALGAALDQRGDAAAAWPHFAQGNARRRAIGHYRAEAAEAGLDRLRRTLTAPALASRADAGLPDPAPIFIVGLPRSGSTLVEQMLASHSAVEGTHELLEIGRLAQDLMAADAGCPDAPLHPEALLHLPPGEARNLGARYIAQSRAYRQLGRARFIDKMPNNAWHLGLIDTILPRSVIIDVRREPMACCLANLQQLFGTTAQEFAYDMDDMARHYRTYLGLMAHWHAVLPGRVLTVLYEDLVDDPEGVLRRILAHCDLRFEPACLDFHRTRRSVRTPSSEQVRRPINRDGIDRWRAYEPWLGPLRAALGDATRTWRENAANRS